MEETELLAYLNETQCLMIAKEVKGLKFRPKLHTKGFLASDADLETKFRFIFDVTSICHQTRSLRNEEAGLYGWGWLGSGFKHLADYNPEFLEPNYRAELALEEIIGWLKPLFSPDGNPENCRLDRLEERARFLKDNSVKIRDNYNSSVVELVESCDNKLAGESGYYNRFRDFKAYDDSYGKKIGVFLRTLMNHNTIKKPDDYPEKFVPIIDYHMMRFLLRTGCVEVIDSDFRDALIKKSDMETDEPIRRLSVDSIKKVAEFSGRNYEELNDMFWTLGRSCCEEKLLCYDGECNKEPCTFNSWVELESHGDCIFNGVCKGSYLENYRNLWEPMVNTYHY